MIVPKQSIPQQVARFSPLIPLLLCAGLSQSVLTTALPYITNDLNGLSLYSWVTWTYTISLALVIPVWIYVLARWPQRLILRVSILVYIAGLGISGLSGISFFNATLQTGMHVFLAGRVMQGLGMSGTMVWAFTLISDENFIEGRRFFRNSLIVFPIVYIFGLVLGPYFGAQISDHFSWHWIFPLLLIVALTTLFLGHYSKFSKIRNEKIVPILVLTLFFVLIPIISFFPYAVTAFLFFRRVNVPINHVAS